MAESTLQRRAVVWYEVHVGKERSRVGLYYRCSTLGIGCTRYGGEQSDRVSRWALL